MRCMLFCWVDAGRTSCLQRDLFSSDKNTPLSSVTMKIPPSDALYTPCMRRDAERALCSLNFFVFGTNETTPFPEVANQNTPC